SAIRAGTYAHQVSLAVVPVDVCLLYSFFFFNDTATTEIYTLSLHDALPISNLFGGLVGGLLESLSLWTGIRSLVILAGLLNHQRSEEHTSELQSRFDLVCRLLLEKKKQKNNI